MAQPGLQRRQVPALRAGAASAEGRVEAAAAAPVAEQKKFAAIHVLLPMLGMWIVASAGRAIEPAPIACAVQDLSGRLPVAYPLRVCLGKAMKRTAALFCLFALGLMGAAGAETYPKFKFDAAWPLQMPHGYFFGQIAGLTVDRHGNVWVISRPRSIVPQLDEPPQEASGVPAPVGGGVRRQRQVHPRLGRALHDERGRTGQVRLAGAGARHRGRRQGQRLDLRQRPGRQERQGRQPVPEVHHRRQIPHAGRPVRPEQGQPGHRQPQPRRPAGLLAPRQ